MTRQRIADLIAILGGIGVLLGTVFLLVHVAGDARLYEVSEDSGFRFIHQIAALGWLLLALGGGLSLILAWLLSRAGEGARAEEERRRQAAEKRAEAAQAALEEKKLRAEEADGARERAERSRQVEREWNRELRERLGRLYSERRFLTDMEDVRSLVLHTAISLLDAEKGLLLERVDDSDELRVCRAEGFDNDPDDARLVRRFAREVVDRDTILREDSLDDDPEATAADREVDNLVAIPLYIADQFGGVVVAANREGGFHEHDDQVLLALGDHASAVLDNSKLQADLRSSYLGSVRMLAEAIEAKDSSLRGHAEDVLGYVMAVAEQLDLDEEQRENLLFGSLLHDVGKIGISERILAKPGPLTAEERSVIELHPRIGYQLVQQVPGLRGVGLAVLHHHERWDGNGYPGGLSGDEIPLAGRIVAIADSFDAMTTDRPYRKGMSLEGACAELERCAGTQFDPDIVKLFLEEVRKRPPEDGESGVLALALEDPELAHRSRGQGLVGGAAAALSDPLTLLYARRWFDAALTAAAPAAVMRNEPFTVVMIDLAALEDLNRTEGLDAGDGALIAAAGAASRAAALLNGSACRFSGARLALLVPAVGEGLEAGLLLLGDELDALPGGGRCAAATWVPGDTGHDVLSRARGAFSIAS